MAKVGLTDLKKCENVAGHKLFPTLKLTTVYIHKNNASMSSIFF